MTKRLSIWLLFFAVLIFFTLPTNAQTNSILVLEGEGAVTPAMASYFARGVAEGEATDSPVLVLLNTPGGGLDPTLNIVSSFRNATVPVIVFVSPRGAQAASAGSIITAAGHVAAMAPETIIGAASPINSDGTDINDTAYRKAVEDLKATMRSLTEQRGPEAMSLAEEMIEDARAVSASEALEVGFIDVVANNVDDLLTEIDGRTVLVDGDEQVLETAALTQQPIQPTFLEIVLQAIANPVLIGILLPIGILALTVEFYSPGGYVGGFVGIIFIGLALYGLGQLPVNWLGLGLVIVAFILFVLEATTPTNGPLALTGTLALIGGLLVLFNTNDAPEFSQIPVGGAVGIGIGTAAFFLFITGKALAAQNVPALTGSAGLVGQMGVVRTIQAANPEKSRYTGNAMVNGELWKVEATEPLAAGDDVQVTAVRGFTLQVTKD